MSAFLAVFSWIEMKYSTEFGIISHNVLNVFTFYPKKWMIKDDELMNYLLCLVDNNIVSKTSKEQTAKIFTLINDSNFNDTLSGGTDMCESEIYT